MCSAPHCQGTQMPGASLPSSPAHSSVGRGGVEEGWSQDVTAPYSPFSTPSFPLPPEAVRSCFRWQEATQNKEADSE